jgi:hypothetical protein
MNSITAIRRAWAAFLGAALFGFSFLVMTPPLGTRTVDSLAALGVATIGGVAGVWLERRVMAAVAARRTEGSTAGHTASPTAAAAGR